MKFTIIKSCLARFSGIFALGTPSNIHGTAISYRCAKFGAFVNSVTILTLRDLTNILSGSFIIYSLKRAVSRLIFILLLVFYHSTKITLGVLLALLYKRAVSIDRRNFLFY